ncbi:MAG: hypothetical protein RL693_967 [Verrucomicrobiota bacterium]|jgi:hypothetical protein
MRFVPLFLLLLTLCGKTHGEGLNGKVMCGYQGWFRVPADGTNTGWHHYSPGKTFEPGACSIELWPDVRELPAQDRVPTEFRHPDGSVAEVFSAVRASTTDLHFQWMRDYGIDGVFLQRFAVTTRDPRYRKPMDTVLEHCRTAAQSTGRCWSLMYDLTGIKPGEIKIVIEDWKRLQELFRFTDGAGNSAYLKHRGKPLVALWGLGFNDRAPMLDEWRELIRFFKNEAAPGGCSVMLGVPAFWRTLNRDAIADPALHELMAMADVVSPWTIGRYHSPESVTAFVHKTVREDIVWCQQHQLDYLPVAYPGFSWHNLSASRGQSAPFNPVPRLGGRFLWSQFLQFHEAGAKMQYVAMFDEMDEGTAIFKCRHDPPTGKSPFLAEPEIPNDHYLWLTGAAGRLLRGEIKAEANELPLRKK